ncbi:Lrp/AsnC family transcriptional regulator [Candidatus Micrarchaeota archaeon]|nr:Lrp/AsnC family transcriptional regulator [Candidatus Micrarchaeota archaeon]
MEKKRSLVDDIDRKMLRILDANSRINIVALSRKIGISRERATYRLERLVKCKIIDKFLTRIDQSKLGFMVFRVYNKLRNDSIAKNYDKFVLSLNQKSQVTWVASLGGEFDNIFEIVASSPQDFSAKISQILNENPNLIESYVVVLESRSEYANRTFLAQIDIPKIVQKTNQRKNNHEFKIDRLDRKILELISGNSRLKNAEIAQRAGCTPNTVAKKIRILEQSGIITGYTISINENLLGIVSYRAKVAVSNLTKETENKLFAYAKEHNNFTNITSVIGPWSIELHCQVHSPEEYIAAILEIRRAFPQTIRAIESLSVFKVHKWDYLPAIEE